MFKIYHIRLIIELCRQMSAEGLINEKPVTIPQLEIDIVLPEEFLGVHNNPAIFVNSATYRQLKKFHINWVENRTLAFKQSFLTGETIDIIGAVIHETGHAFNVAANISNTEDNAYIYEIEVMRKLFATNSPLLFGCSFTEVQSYFKRRLAYYCINHKNNPKLNNLIESISIEFQLTQEKLQSNSPPTPIEHSSSFKNKNRTSLFSYPDINEDKESIDLTDDPERVVEDASTARKTAI